MHLQQCNDHKLIAEWRLGNRTAFNLLFDRYFHKLLHFTATRLGNREQAEELVMDVMLRLWQRQDELGTDDSLSPYLFRAVKNAIIDQYRKNGLKTLQLDEGYLEYPVATAVEEQYQAKELEGICDRGIATLSPQRKKVFELSRVDGKSHKEISLEMNVSVSTVKQHINASLHTLREIVKQHTDIAFLTISLFLL